MSSHKLEASLFFYFEWAISWRVSRAASSTRPSGTKHEQPTGPIQKPIHLKAHLFLFFARRSIYFLKRGRSQENPPSSSLPLTLLYRPNSPRSPSSSLVQKTPAHLLPHYTENARSSSSTPTESPSPPSSPLALPLGSSLATLLKPVSLVQRPQGKWSQLAPVPTR